MKLLKVVLVDVSSDVHSVSRLQLVNHNPANNMLHLPSEQHGSFSQRTTCFIYPANNTTIKKYIRPLCNGHLFFMLMRIT